MKRERRRQFRAKLRAFGRFRQQLVQPDPRQTAKGNLQCASPVDPQRIRIRLDPTAPLCHQFASVLLVAAQQAGLGQRHQVLVTVQFPYDLVVAHHREIKKRNLEPWFHRRTLAVHRVEMPVDLSEIDAFEIAAAAINREGKVLVAEQAKTMATNLICLAQNFARFAGQMFAQQLCAL